MSHTFRRTAILKKIWIVNLSFTPKHSTEKKSRALHALKDLEPIFKLSIHLSLRKSREKL